MRADLRVWMTGRDEGCFGERVWGWRGGEFGSGCGELAQMGNGRGAGRGEGKKVGRDDWGRDEFRSECLVWKASSKGSFQDVGKPSVNVLMT